MREFDESDSFESDINKDMTGSFDSDVNSDKSGAFDSDVNSDSGGFDSDVNSEEGGFYWNTSGGNDEDFEWNAWKDDDDDDQTEIPGPVIHLPINLMMTIMLTRMMKMTEGMAVAEAGALMKVI